MNCKKKIHRGSERIYSLGTYAAARKIAKYDSAVLRDIVRMRYPIKAVPRKVL